MNDMEAEARTADGSRAADLEQALVSLWQQLLGRDRIQLDANFFELGGNSVLAMKLLEDLDTRFAVQLPLVTLFQAPTIRELAQAINEAERI